MDKKAIMTGAVGAGMALATAAATAPNKIKGGEVSQEFKDSKVNQNFYKGYGFLDGSMPYVDPPSLRQRAASGVAGGLMQLLTGLVTDPAKAKSSNDANPMEILSSVLSGKLPEIGGLFKSAPNMGLDMGSVGEQGQLAEGESSGREIFAPIIDRVSNSLGIDPSLGMAIGAIESNFNRMAKGKAGEIGAFQVKPGTAKEVLGEVDDLFDPETNVTAGLSYLKKQIDKFGSLPKAIAAYNWGPGNVEKLASLDDDTFLERVPAQVRNYVNKALENTTSMANLNPKKKGAWV